jgi:hypothetical protein
VPSFGKAAGCNVSGTLGAAHDHYMPFHLI